jgi:iron complex transport system ATP-binding protein
MIRLSSVDVRVGGHLLLRGIDARIERGTFVAVLGPNGVGKTTLVRAVAGTHASYGGTIAIDGDDVRDLAASRRARRIAYVASDEVFLEYLTVRDVVAMGRYPFRTWWRWDESPEDDARIEAALHAVKMEGFAGRAFATLSSGERQRVWLAVALAQEAPVLLLDEPTSHLDVRVAHEILALLRDQVRRGKTVVCVLHDLNEAAEFADDVMLLGDGRLLAHGPAANVLTSPVLSQAYGIAMESLRTPAGALRVFPRP